MERGNTSHDREIKTLKEIDIETREWRQLALSNPTT